LIVAAPAEGDEAIEVEIGAALGVLDDMMDIEPAKPAAGLATPPARARTSARMMCHSRPHYFILF
jgi:hypothetical protein